MKEAILKALSPDYPWKSQFTWFDTVDSTNNYLKAQALLGAPHGSVAVADCQTGGKGRLGRSFHSPGGVGVYLSILLRPQRPPEEFLHLTCAVGTAMCDALERACGIRPGIKWTNDLVFGRKKAAGILTELGTDGTECYAVVGIGVNCCQKAADFPPELRDKATSLAMEAGRPIDRSVVAAAMMDALYRMEQGLFTEKEAMLSQYKKDCVTLGKEISLVQGDEVSHGTALDIGENGDLIVRFENGTVRPVSSGEVSVRGMYGYV